MVAICHGAKAEAPLPDGALLGPEYALRLTQYGINAQPLQAWAARVAQRPEMYSVTVQATARVGHRQAREQLAYLRSLLREQRFTYAVANAALGTTGADADDATAGVKWQRARQLLSRAFKNPAKRPRRPVHSLLERPE